MWNHFWHRTTSNVVLELAFVGTLKFGPKSDRFCQFSIIIAFAIKPFLPVFKIVSFLEYCVFEPFKLQADKFLKCDWLRPVVFKPKLKYLYMKIMPFTLSSKFLCLVAKTGNSTVPSGYLGSIRASDISIQI